MKTRVYIATTQGPAELTLLVAEEAHTPGRAEVFSDVYMSGSSDKMPIAGAYKDFVRRPSGVIEKLFGHPVFIMELSRRISGGDSWKLGVFAAHALFYEDQLAQAGDPADRSIWLTGNIGRGEALPILAVGHLEQKLENSAELFKQLVGEGKTVQALVPSANFSQLDTTWLSDWRSENDLNESDLEIWPVDSAYQLGDLLNLNHLQQCLQQRVQDPSAGQQPSAYGNARNSASAHSASTQHHSAQPTGSTNNKQLGRKAGFVAVIVLLAALLASQFTNESTPPSDLLGKTHVDEEQVANSDSTYTEETPEPLAPTKPPEAKEVPRDPDPVDKPAEIRVERSEPPIAEASIESKTPSPSTSTPEPQRVVAPEWETVGFWDYDPRDGLEVVHGFVLTENSGIGNGKSWAMQLSLIKHAELHQRPRSLWPIQLNRRLRLVCVDVPGYPSYAGHIDVPGSDFDGGYQFGECKGETRAGNQDCSHYMGNWTGNFAGDDSGFWSMTVQCDGGIVGSGYSFSDQELFDIRGRVDERLGEVAAGITGSNAEWSGSFSGETMSGTWKNPMFGDVGTMTSKKL